jgi:hypothetical protein
LDLVLGRSGKAYADWLRSRGDAFTAGITTASLDPFRGYANAIRDELDDAVAVNLLRQLIHDMNEMTGHLQMRSQVEVSGSVTPLANFDVIAVDKDGNWHGVADR